MPKITRKRLARGTKLTVQAVYQPMQDLQTALGSNSLAGANLTQPNGTFRVNLNFPRVTSKWFIDSGSVLHAGFALPPLQQDWSTAHALTPEVPQPTLIGVGLSWDQRDEPYGITDEYSGTNEGYMTNVDMGRYTLEFSIYEKTPYSFDTDKKWPERTVCSFTIPGQQAFGSQDSRQNPMWIGDLNEQFNPYKAYGVVVRFTGLTGLPAEENLGVPSFNCSLQFRYPLRSRLIAIDPTNPEVQNYPITPMGNYQPTNVPLTLPAADSLIQADNGLNADLAKFDQILLERLQSGFGPESEVAPQEQHRADTAYEVIAVPMWGAWEDLRAGGVATAGLPYVVAPWLTPTMSNRFIPVPEGFVLHHVVAYKSWLSPPANPVTGLVTWGSHPTAHNYVEKIGVALCSAGTDDYAYQQLAYTQIAGDETYSKCLDRVVTDPKGGHWTGGLFPVPLVSPVSVDKSYQPTGNPIFMGQSNLTTANRTWIGQMPWAYGAGALAVPATKGTEKYVEIRWSMESSVNGLDDPDGTGDVDKVIIGLGGNWVFLVGTKPTV